MTQRPHKTDIAKEIAKRFPDTPTMTLARKLLKEHPLTFHSLDHARSTVRYVRGNTGRKHRKYASVPKPNGHAGFRLTALPDGIIEMENWEALQVNGDLRGLMMQDVHCPFHSKDSIMLSVERGRKDGVNLVVLNGDIIDCHTISHWQRLPDERHFVGEVDTGKALLKYIRDAFPKARILWKQGNHEERYEVYLGIKAPELFNIPAFKWESLFELDSLGIEYVRDMRPILLGKLNVLHGHEYRFAISNPVNPARGLFLRAKTHATCAHFHRSSHHSEKNLEQNVVTCWSQGCLCDMHPRYSPLNAWNQGFAIINVDKRGAFETNNYRIIDGGIYQ